MAQCGVTNKKNGAILGIFKTFSFDTLQTSSKPGQNNFFDSSKNSASFKNCTIFV